jgi:hypothetical protein
MAKPAKQLKNPSKLRRLWLNRRNNMETALYIIIGTMSLLTLIGIPGIIWGIRDNKRRERQEQEGASTTV